MPVARRTVSITSELDSALNFLLKLRGEDRSRLIETLLRESPLVQRQIQKERLGFVNPGFKKGRDLAKLRTLGKLAKTKIDRKIAAGELKITRIEDDAS